MDFIFKTAYYAATAISTLVIGFLFLANVFGKQAAGDTWRAKAIATAAAGVGFGLLWLAVRLGHLEGQWLAGLGVAVAALVAAAIVMIGGLLLFTTVRWN